MAARLPLFFFVAALSLCAVFSLPDAGRAARMTGSGGGVGGMGYGRPAPPQPARSAPPSSYGGATRRDHARGYTGHRPDDPWHRDSDFSSRNWQFQHGPEPQVSRPPVPPPSYPPDVARTPSLVIPRLPRESSLPQDSTDVSGRRRDAGLGIRSQERPGPENRPGSGRGPRVREGGHVRDGH